MIWFRKNLPNIILCLGSCFIAIKWIRSGSNFWPVLLMVCLYIVGFGIRTQSKS